jgi:hypothetical protein
MLQKIDKLIQWHHVYSVKPEAKEVSMVIAPTHHAIISLIAGILILIMPRLLNYIVAIYLIITGLLALVR